MSQPSSLPVEQNSQKLYQMPDVKNISGVSGIGRPVFAGLASALISFALLLAAAWQFGAMHLTEVTAMIPASPAFWIIFALYYLVQPISEWIIYRRLWQIPMSGIGALLRKLVSNEVLLGYLGEAQFYAWARSRTQMTTSPFGAIKDVTILSALTGNLATLVMLVFAWPLLANEAVGMHMRSAFISLGVVLITSLAILLFRQRLFTLPRHELFRISAIHCFRIAIMLGLSAVMWHYVLPHVAIGLWLILATLRMLASRLPLLPNKDVVFAGMTVYLMGNDIAIGDLMAMMATILLATHLVIGTVFSLADLVASRNLARLSQ